MARSLFPLSPLSFPDGFKPKPAYFIYGKKQQVFVPMIVGVLLTGYTFFISDLTIMIVIGVVLSIVPYFIRV
jgi:hypothetical protein